MNAAFKFPRLNPSKNEIRLIELNHRTNAEEQVTCELIVHDLELYEEGDSPLYTALSYTWGKRSSNKIIVNGHDYFVYDNLFDFLSMKSLDEQFCQSKLLWIDQLCINQDDIPERNQQVNLMGDVYKTARETIIWLGRPGLNAGLSKDEIKLLAQLQRFPPPLPSSSRVAYDFFLSRNISRDDWYREWRHFHQYPVYGLFLLSTCQYWNRVWIIQEVLLSRQLVINYDEETISWDTLHKYTEMCSKYLRLRHWDGNDPTSEDVEVDLLFRKQLYGVGKLLHYRQQMTQNPNYLNEHTWYNAIEDLAVEAQCEDPRDRVFGLLGLMPSSVRIPVDYSTQPEDILVQILNVEIISDPGSWDLQKYGDWMIPKYATFAARLARGLGAKQYVPKSMARSLVERIYENIRAEIGSENRGMRSVDMLVK